MRSITLRRFLLSAGVALVMTPAAFAAQPESFLQTVSSPSFDTDFTVAAERTVNSVVCIQSFATPRQQYYGNPFGDFFDFFGFGFPGQQQPQQQQRKQQKQEMQPTGTGSGVIVSDDGYIVTNHHVIDGAEKLEVLLNDNSTYTATVIGSDEATDLALIKIDATGLKPIVFGNSDNVKIGQWVLAVGNPFGLNSTVTAGIISAKGRALDGGRNGKMGIESYLQTDAAINPGNSGGALVNLSGELIGINAAIYSRTGSYTGYSFAIPTTIVSKIITDLKTYGTVQRGLLGITCRSLDAALAKELNIKSTTTGVVVFDVNEGSTGADLGLQKNDIIVGINDATIHTLPEMQERLATLRPGDAITVKYYHDNKLVTRSATLKDSHGKTALVKRNDYSVLGATLEVLTEAEMKKLNVQYGLKVTDVKAGSLLANEGVRKGSVILTVNEVPMRNEKDFMKVYKAILDDDENEPVMWLVGLMPNSQKKFYCAIPLTTEQ